MVQECYRNATGMVQEWYRNDTEMAQQWYRNGTGMIQEWCRNGIGMAHEWNIYTSQCQVNICNRTLHRKYLNASDKHKQLIQVCMDKSQKPRLNPHVQELRCFLIDNL